MADPNLAALIAAAVQATEVASSAMTNVWGTDSDSPAECVATMEREGTAAREALVGALAAYGYAPCYGCGRPTPAGQMVQRRLSDASVHPHCMRCMEMVALLSAAFERRDGAA